MGHHISDRIKHYSGQGSTGSTTAGQMSSGASSQSGSEETSASQQKRPRHSAKRSPDRQMLKTRICNSFAKGGFCKYGADCNFAHAYTELQEAPDLRKTRLCKAFASGWCNDSNCNFAHGQEELRATDRYYKTSICVWHTRGKCTNGELCRFAHGHHELRTGGADHSTKANTGSEQGTATPPTDDPSWAGLQEEAEAAKVQPRRESPAYKGSWAAKNDLRSERRRKPLEAPAQPARTSDEVKQWVSAILRQFMAERSDALYSQLVQCALSSLASIDALAQALLEEASLRSSSMHFTGMCADLCYWLVMDLGESGPAFQQAVVGRCWELFNQNFGKQRDPLWVMEEALAGEDEESPDEERIVKKQMALGSVYFLAELTIRDVHPSREVLSAINRLLERPAVPERLEALAGLLSVLGPARDNAMWPEHAELGSIFWQVRSLTCDPELPTRLRCMLQDLLAWRDAGWSDAKRAGQVPLPLQRSGAPLDGYSMSPAGAQTSPSALNLEMGVAGGFPAWGSQGNYAGGTMILVPMPMSPGSALPPGAQVVAVGPQGCAPGDVMMDQQGFVRQLSAMSHTSKTSTGQRA